VLDESQTNCLFENPCRRRPVGVPIIQPACRPASETLSNKSVYGGDIALPYFFEGTASFFKADELVAHMWHELLKARDGVLLLRHLVTVYIHSGLLRKRPECLYILC